MQAHRHPGQTRFSGLLDAVVVVVAVDKAADLRAYQLAKVVVDAVVTGRQHHMGDDIVRERHIAALAACGVLAVKVGARLNLGDGIDTRYQAGEFVKTGRVGDSAEIDACALRIIASEQDGDAANGGLAVAANTVVAEIFIDIARQPGRQNFAEVVARAILAGAEGGLDHIIGATRVGRATLGAQSFGIFQITRRLDFLDIVGAGWQVGETVVAI